MKMDKKNKSQVLVELSISVLIFCVIVFVLPWSGVGSYDLSDINIKNIDKVDNEIDLKIESKVREYLNSENLNPKSILFDDDQNIQISFDGNQYDIWSYIFSDGVLIFNKIK